ncbi:MAG TPA: tetratricopeptide repeat protein, partial [Chloroflexota bacterium]|nr:tetratricopeptide repeat protein [Chloroflexota bacterium]
MGAAPPLPPARFVDRPRLRETLAGAVPLGLAVLVAPGGFGKSVALADFAGRAPFPIAWLGLSAAECDLVAFVEALAGAVGRHVPGFGRQSVKVARQSGSNTVLALADQLAGELADHGAPIGIVLDDLHKVDGAADVAKLVAELVERRPSNCFFAIASRTLPNLPYARLIALGRMAGIPADELRFTREEAAQFLERPPEDEEVDRVLDATGGWAAALALGTGSAHFPAVLDEYLEHEVFLQQQPPVQAFLLRASVPPTLDEDVCRRLLEAPEGPQLLTRAHRAGLFVSALPDGRWRLHDLFRDFLRARLRQTDPALWERLNRAVADDMAASHHPVEAVTQLVDADLHEAAADLLLRYAAEFAVEGRWGAVRGWMDKLPPRVVKERPRLLTLQGRALLLSSPAMAISLFDQAIEACLGSGDVVGAADALGHRAARLVLSGRNAEAAEDCARVRDMLRGRDHPILAIAARVEGAIAARAGDFPTAFERLAEALDRAQRLRDTALTASVERNLGWVHTATGDLGAGTAHYERAAEAWREVGDLRSLAEVQISLGHLYAEQGAVASARAKFGDALELAERLGDTRTAGFALDNLGVLERDSGDVETATKLLERATAMARQA